MATEKKSIGDRVGTLHGVIVRSPFDGVEIEEIVLPSLESGMFVLSSADIPGKNIIITPDGEFPLLVETVPAYTGQPVMAIFGPDNESVELKAQTVNVVGRNEDSAREKLVSEVYHTEERVFSAPGTAEEDIIPEDVTLVERELFFPTETSDDSEVIIADAVYEKGRMEVQVGCQDPFLLKKTVSDATGLEEDEVNIIPRPYFAPNDDRLLEPVTIATLAAAAALKFRRPVRIESRSPAYKPSVWIKRKTIVAHDGTPLTEEIECEIDEGAYPVYANEACLRAIAGLTPLYPLKHLSIRVSVLRTNHHPANVYGSFAYSEAIMSSNIQAAAIADVVSEDPITWKTEHHGPSPALSAAIKTAPFPELSSILKDISAKSDFKRKSAAYSQVHGRGAVSSGMWAVSRGLGVACAPGLSGFSSRFRNRDFKVAVTLNRNKTAVINSSLPRNEEETEDFWKDEVSQNLGIPAENISVLPFDDPSILNSGPDILSRPTGTVPNLLARAAKNLKKRMDAGEKLPLYEEILMAPGNPSPKAPLFSSSSWGVVVIEVEIDPVTLTPIVKNIWATVDFGIIENEKSLRAKTRRVITSAIRDYGAVFRHGIETEAAFEIRLINRREGTASSLSATMKALTTVALHIAVCRALDYEFQNVPASPWDIFSNISPAVAEEAPESEIERRRKAAEKKAATAKRAARAPAKPAPTPEADASQTMSSNAETAPKNEAEPAWETTEQNQSDSEVKQ